VYSLRAKEQPTASTPVKWEEVEDCLEKGDPKLLVFEAGKVLERAKKFGDLFAPVLKLKQKMPPLEALQGIESGPAVGPSVRKPKEKKATPGVVGGRAKPAAGKKAATTRKRGWAAHTQGQDPGPAAKPSLDVRDLAIQKGDLHFLVNVDQLGIDLQDLFRFA